MVSQVCLQEKKAEYFLFTFNHKQHNNFETLYHATFIRPLCQIVQSLTWQDKIYYLRL